MNHQLLQERLAEESAVLSAAEGLTDGQRMLARDMELSAIIKNATAERDEIRADLKQEHEKTGERIELGGNLYSPYMKDNFTYNTEEFMRLFPDLKGCLKVDGTKVTAVMDAGMIPRDKIDQCRTNAPTLTHNTVKVKP